MKPYTTQAEPNNPRKSVTIYLDAETIALVEAVASREDISFSGAARRLIRAGATTNDHPRNQRDR